MKKLHLLRHAKAEAFSSSGEDVDRKLHKKAEQQLNLVNQFLKMNQLTLDQIFCSSAKRTRETLNKLVCLKGDVDIIYDEDLYLASSAQLLRFICANGNGNEILLVGHNEGISELASYLTNQNIHLETANLCTISFEIDEWIELTQGTGKIEVFFAPKDAD